MAPPVFYLLRWPLTPVLSNSSAPFRISCTVTLLPVIIAALYLVTSAREPTYLFAFSTTSPFYLNFFHYCGILHPDTLS